ncbi:MAG: nucleotidyltransferase domain-containing protein [Gemmatimonadota bacterium]
MLKWPDAQVVRAQLSARAHEIARADKNVRAIGYIGSLTSGEWGVGSDVDIIVVVAQANAAPHMRAAAFDFTALPVPADVMVYAEAEYERLVAESSRFGRALAAAQWVVRR